MHVARGATYLSANHRASPSIPSSKNRTGDTAFFTPSIRDGNSSVGPSTHPLVAFPWNGTWTSDPTPAWSDSSSE
jgi:hypothetical protein